jgi:hypothetical protein
MTIPTRARLELAIVAAFALALAAVPLFTTELYPFSRAPMFCDAPTRYCRYELRGPGGATLPLDAFGLQRNYWGNPPVGHGFLPPASLDQFGEVPTRDIVTAYLRERLAGRLYLDVTQEVIGPRDDGGVGPVARERWRIDNP